MIRTQGIKIETLEIKIDTQKNMIEAQNIERKILENEIDTQNNMLETQNYKIETHYKYVEAEMAKIDQV
jgi:hypothetical protein